MQLFKARHLFDPTVVVSVCRRFVHVPLVRQRPLLAFSDSREAMLNCLGSSPSLHANQQGRSEQDLELPRLAASLPLLQLAREVDCSAVTQPGSVSPIAVQFVAAVSEESRRFVFSVAAYSNLAKSVSRAFGNTPLQRLKRTLCQVSGACAEIITLQAGSLRTLQRLQQLLLRDPAEAQLLQQQMLALQQVLQQHRNSDHPDILVQSPALAQQLRGLVFAARNTPLSPTAQQTPAASQSLAESAGANARPSIAAAAAHALIPLLRGLSEARSPGASRSVLASWESAVIQACNFLRTCRSGNSPHASASRVSSAFLESLGRMHQESVLQDGRQSESTHLPSDEDAPSSLRALPPAGGASARVAATGSSTSTAAAAATSSRRLFLHEQFLLRGQLRQRVPLRAPLPGGREEAFLEVRTPAEGLAAAAPEAAAAAFDNAAAAATTDERAPQTQTGGDGRLHSGSLRAFPGGELPKLMRYYKDQAGLRDDVVEFLWIKRKVVTRLLPDLSPMDYRMQRGQLQLFAEARPSLQYAQKVWISLFIEGSEEAPYLPRLRFNASMMTPFSRLSESYSRNVGVAEGDLLLFYSREQYTVQINLSKCPLDYDVRENDVVKAELRPGAAIPVALAEQYEQTQRHALQRHVHML
ncbi:ubiquitin domain at the c- related protein [Cyclospora cayetanensis]|uniref:Ubiquitin domain at the c-related protein n=1 Tax=Cyclospora cayetanensis TaxID=88456 RepID=A0A1D3CRZ1_9EIME|nr:ubiquitin domain at the c- related protein [Cyclospora cayetanensis]